jgi:CheY-like chemotaxis protein
MKKLDSILLIDDDNVTNFLTQNLIESLDVCHHIFAYKNGQEALNHFIDKDQFSKVPANIIFLDLNMPVMDGYQFMANYHKLSSEFKTAKIIVLVAENSITPPEKIVETLGADGYFNKPITKEKIEQIIEKYFI